MAVKRLKAWYHRYGLAIVWILNEAIAITLGSSDKLDIN